MPFSPAVLGHWTPSVSGQYKKALTLDISWHYAFLLLPFFYIVYLYLVFKEEPRWKIAERAKKNRQNEII